MNKIHKKKNTIIGLTAVCLAVSLFVLYEFWAPKSFLHLMTDKTENSGDTGKSGNTEDFDVSEGEKKREDSEDLGNHENESNEQNPGDTDIEKEDIKTDNNEVIIALIDTGADTEYAAISDYIWKNPNEISGNGVDDDGNGFVDDLYGWDFYNDDNTVFHDISYDTGDEEISEDAHGTKAAVTIVGILNDILNEETSDNNLSTEVSDNNLSLKVKIMILKVNGGKESAGISSDALKAIRYAEKMGADICNLSWGTYEYDKYLADEIKNSNMLFVCSAGNDGTDNDLTPVYPGALLYDNVISVTGCKKTENGYVVTGNRGKKTVQLCTEDEESDNVTRDTQYEESDNVTRDKQYEYEYENYDMTGTSFSAAKVTGYISALTAGLNITTKEAKNILINESVSVRNIEGVKYGLVSTDTVAAYVREHVTNDN